MNLWLMIVCIGIATFAMRLSFMALFGRGGIPDWLRRALRFVPASVLAAIVVPDLLLQGGALSLMNPRLFAGVIAAIIAWRTRSAPLTLGVGMVSLWVLQGLEI
jgi:branched-subunit amino acid transport protein